MTFDVVKVNAKGQEVEREKAEASYFTQDLGNDITLEMIAILGGTFTMGSPANEKDTFDDERPQHQVTVPPFFMGKYPVTQAQWRAVASRTDLKVEKDLDPDPSYFKDPPKPPLKRGASDSPPFEGGARGGSPTRWDRPVERVNWYDAVEFCARLSKLTGREYRLPGEAEWEYACRAGTTTRFYFGDDANQLGDYAWYNGNSQGTTHPVGQKKPNAWGLYEMSGNVWEWCEDNWHNYNDNDYRILRGGSWYDDPYSCRSASRNDLLRRVNFNSLDGFRVVCGVGRTL